MADRDHWIVVGSSPSAPRGFDWASRRYPTAKTIACNGSIDIFKAHGLWPDYYWISDQQACRIFRDESLAAQQNGTLILTMKRTESGINHRRIEHADRFLDMPSHDGDKPLFRSGKYVYSGFAGTICLQVAVNSGACHVVIVGMDGYRSEPGAVIPDTFSGRIGKPGEGRMTREWIGPFTQSVFDEAKDIQFELVGQPVYEWSAPNLTIVNV